MRIRLCWRPRRQPLSPRCRPTHPQPLPPCHCHALPLTLQRSCATPLLCLLCPRALQTLGEQGEVDAAQAATTEAERLKGARVAYEAQAQARANARVGKNLNQQVGGGEELLRRQGVEESSH